MGEFVSGASVWWLTAFLFTRVEAFGTESMVACHEMLARVDRSISVSAPGPADTRMLAGLPTRLVQMIELDVVMAVTCIDNDTLMEMTGASSARKGYGNSPVTPYRDAERAPDTKRLPPSPSLPTPTLPRLPTPSLPHEEADPPRLMTVPLRVLE